jgi:serine protease inhibitor
MEIFLLTLSVLAFFNALWIYKFYSMKRTYLKAGKCIVQLIDKVQKAEFENEILNSEVTVLRVMINNKTIKRIENLVKTNKKKANTKLRQKTKQAKIRGK